MQTLFSYLMGLGHKKYVTINCSSIEILSIPLYARNLSSYDIKTGSKAQAKLFVIKNRGP